MKKKLIVSVSALVVVALTTFLGQRTLCSQSSMTDLLLDENVEALSRNESITITYSCHYNFLINTWRCEWYLSGSDCTGCTKPTNG